MDLVRPLINDTIGASVGLLRYIEGDWSGKWLDDEVWLEVLKYGYV